MTPKRLLSSETVRFKPGERARSQLLEAAGEVFAERGYAEATSKEICERAGMNSASVNYHFGGFDPLYAQALAHAHQALYTIEQAREIASSPAAPKDKLRAYIALIMRRLAVPSTSWEVRLISREIVSSSPVHDAFIETVVMPKAQVLRGILAEVLDVAPEDPVVGRSVLMVVSPSLMLAVAHRDIVNILVPDALGPDGAIQPLIDHFQRFIIAGLESFAEAAKKSHSPPVFAQIALPLQTESET